MNDYTIASVQRALRILKLFLPDNLPVHDADHALVGISKGLYHNFIAGAEIFRQSLCQTGV